MWTIRQYLSQFGNPNHVINGFGQESIVDLDVEVKEVTWGATAGTGLLQHWSKHGAVILRFMMNTVPEYTAYLVVDDSSGAEWEFGRVTHVRKYGNDYKYTDKKGSRPFATLRITMGELAKTKKMRASDSFDIALPVHNDLPDLT